MTLSGNNRELSGNRNGSFVTSSGGRTTFLYHGNDDIPRCRNSAPLKLGIRHAQVLWIARTGSPWRDLPPALGKWNTVFKRFRDWVKADVFQRIFDALSDEPDMEFAMIDGTIVKVHRHGQGAKGGLKARP